MTLVTRVVVVVPMRSLFLFQERYRRRLHMAPDRGGPPQESSMMTECFLDYRFDLQDCRERSIPIWSRTHPDEGQIRKEQERIEEMPECGAD